MYIMLLGVLKATQTYLCNSSGFSHGFEQFSISFQLLPRQTTYCNESPFNKLQSQNAKRGFIIFPTNQIIFLVQQ